MPLTLNIGLSRKVGEPNYGSRGASINIELEVESALIADPARFRERVRQLFRQVRDSLTEELNGGPLASGNSLPSPPLEAPKSNGGTHMNGVRTGGNANG